MFLSTLNHILPPSAVAAAMAVIDAAPFVDGRVSGGYVKKQNLELAGDSEAYVELLGRSKVRSEKTRNS